MLRGFNSDDKTNQIWIRMNKCIFLYLSSILSSAAYSSILCLNSLELQSKEYSLIGLHRSVDKNLTLNFASNQWKAEDFGWLEFTKYENDQLDHVFLYLSFDNDFVMASFELRVMKRSDNYFGTVTKTAVSIFKRNGCNEFYLILEMCYALKSVHREFFTF